MARNIDQIPLEPVVLDQRLSTSIFASTREIAGSQGLDYMLQDSFFNGIAGETEAPDSDVLIDERLGYYSDLEMQSGRARFIWFDDKEVVPTIVANGGESDLQGSIAFSIDVDNQYFFGELTLHRFGIRARELKVDATGFRAGFSDRADAEISSFVGNLGLVSLWKQVPEAASYRLNETRIRGYAPKHLARNIDHALKDIRGLPRP